MTQVIAICIWKDFMVDSEHVQSVHFNAFLTLRMKHWWQRWIFEVILIIFYYILITSVYIHFSLFDRKVAMLQKAELAEQLCTAMYYLHIGSIGKHLIM